ncbi:MAG: hypothetical protein JSR36_02010 [Proteobacteria bacterium]|nr:hypothetical protein [Pseudomonadota bacterium]
MKALRQLGFLKLSLRAENSSPDEDHRVIELFRNRAELKKQYGSLQEEIFRLKDLIKQQEGATQRVQEMLNTLEGRLSSSETAYAALVFYQLRRLWQSGRELITQFTADLARQQEERERRAHLAQHNRRQFAKKQAAEQQLAAAQTIHDEAVAQQARLEGERAALTRFWHYFKRRALAHQITAAQLSVANAVTALAQARALVEQVVNEPNPEFPGLSLDARRAINIAAIAYAEVLCLRVASLKTPLVAMAREATGQREAPDSYGTPQECVLLMGQINRAQTLIAERAGLPDQIRVRSERLKRVAKYRGANDGAPTTDSIGRSEGDVLESPALGNDAPKLPNVLAEDIWDLFRILLR